MQDLGRLLMLGGAAIATLGGLFWLLGKAGFHGLPGDIRYSSESVRVYVPIVSCLVLSIVISGLMWLWRWMHR